MAIDPNKYVAFDTTTNDGIGQRFGRGPMGPPGPEGPRGPVGPPGEGAAELRADLTETGPGKGAELVAFQQSGAGAVARSQQNKSRERISARDFNVAGDGVTNDYSGLLAAVSEARRVGADWVYLPPGNYLIGSVFSTAAIQNVKFYGEGRIIGAKEYYVFPTATQPQTITPVKILDKKPKLCFQNTAYLTPNPLVASASKGGRYVATEFVNNATTVTSSLATSSSDITAPRARNVRTIRHILVGKITPNSTTGSWTLINGAFSTFPEFQPYTSASPIKIYDTANAGATLTYNNVRAINGQIHLAFEGNTPNATGVQVDVNGVTYTINTQRSIRQVLQVRLPCYEATATVVVRNVSGFIRFFGLNFGELRDWQGGDIDGYGLYWNTADEGVSFGNSENDFVLRDFDTNTFGGGYHGGEVNIVTEWVADGVAFTPSAAPVIGRDIRLTSVYDIDWTPTAGPNYLVHIKKMHEFFEGGYYLTVVADGDLLASEIYSAMYGLVTGFNRIESPKSVTFSSLPSDTRVEVGKATRIEAVNDATGQRFIADITLHGDDFNNQYRGPYFWRVVEVYNKLYYNIVSGGRYQMDSWMAVNRFEFQ